MKKTHFEWDEEKNKETRIKHEVSFSLAQHAFLDPHRIIVEDIISHSKKEERFLLYRSIRIRRHDREVHL